MKPSTAPDKLQPLLEKHHITWAAFSKPGRPPAGMREKRRSIVSELHQAGTPWKEMMRVTGLSLMGLQRLTTAVGNPASRANRSEVAARTGHSRKGERKPWLSDLLREAWAVGSFDFHRGRIRSIEEREVLRLAALRPEVKERRSAASRRRWQRPDERARLLAYHRSEDVRRERSRAQATRIAENPSKWSRGLGAWVQPVKCNRPRVWTRSSYERVVVALLDSDPSVGQFVFEPRVQLPDGFWMLPDFVVYYTDGHVALVEVKASWVLALPSDHKVQRRLRQASTFAASMGWEFIIWTEKDFGDARKPAR